jgi:hypothetical protein
LQAWFSPPFTSVMFWNSADYPVLRPVRIIIISNLSDDRSTASSKTIPPLNAIESFLLQSILSCLQASRIHGISVSEKRLSSKSDNVVVFPFAFHMAVQQPFKPNWSRLLLYELEPSRASFALCFKSLLMTLLPASVFGVSLRLMPTLWPVQQGRPSQ